MTAEHLRLRDAARRQQEDDTLAHDHPEEIQDEAWEAAEQNTAHPNLPDEDKSLRSIEGNAEEVQPESPEPQPTFLLKTERGWLEYIQMGVSIITFGVVIAYTMITHRQANLAQEALEVSRQALQLNESAMKLHLHPELICFLGIRAKSHVFFLANEGSMDAESISVDHAVFYYRKEPKGTRQMEGPSWSNDGPLGPPGFRWFHEEKLRPNEYSRAKQIPLGPPPDEDLVKENLIGIQFFNVSYLRPTDGRLYEKDCVFYKDGDHHYQTPMSFRSNPFFESITQELHRRLERSLAMVKRMNRGYVGEEGVLLRQ